MIDIFSSFLAPLEHELMSRSSYSVGKSHSISHNTNYMGVSRQSISPSTTTMVRAPATTTRRT